MNPPLLPRRLPQDPVLGARASFTRTLTEADVALFIGVTWDVNPLHTDDTYAAAMPFGRRIAPGLLTASLLTHLGGLWAFLANDMRFQFKAPVFIGDTITAEATVAEVGRGARLGAPRRPLRAPRQPRGSDRRNPRLPRPFRGVGPTADTLRSLRSATTSTTGTSATGGRRRNRTGTPADRQVRLGHGSCLL